MNLLLLFEFTFDITVVTETWINNKNDYSFVNIPSYKYECFKRDGRGDGIAVYINELINF